MPETLPALTYDQLLEKPEHSPSHTLAEWRIVNIITGEIVWQRPRTENLITTQGRMHWVYNPALVDSLCEEIVAGGSLTLLCDGVRYPRYAELCRWRRHWPEITQQLEVARRDRAERMRDLALVEAMAATGKDDSAAAQVKFTALKWAAGIDDGKFKDNSKVSVDVGRTTILQVVTGIERGSNADDRTVSEIYDKSFGTNKS